MGDQKPWLYKLVSVPIESEDVLEVGELFVSSDEAESFLYLMEEGKAAAIVGHLEDFRADTALHADVSALKQQRDHFLMLRTDPNCKTCGSSGNAPDGSTCDCYGWYQKDALEHDELLQLALNMYAFLAGRNPNSRLVREFKEHVEKYQ